MARLAEWGRRCWFLLNRRRFEAALRAELRAHRELMPDRKRFGNEVSLHERAVDVWGWRWLDDLGRDARYGLSAMRRAPGATIVIVASLALATGATTAIFSVVNGVVLRPLPFGDPEQLVEVFGRNWRAERPGSVDTVTGPVGPEELQAYRTESTAFAGFAGYAPFTAHLQVSTEVERLAAVRADPSLFDVLEADPLVGQTFRPGETPGVAVISERLWSDRFARDPSAIGRSIVLDGRTRTIVGVMPVSFQFPYGSSGTLAGARPEIRTDVWVPFEDGRRGRLAVVARLDQGRTLQAGLAELQVIAARVERLSPSPEMRVGVRLERLESTVTAGVRGSLWLLFAAVGLVLAAACANVANLLLARTSLRVREIVTRAALGASRTRLIRQFLAESLLLALAGGAVGTLIARWVLRLLTTLATSRLPRVNEVALDWQAFAFLFVVSAVAALLFGLAPALAAARCDVRTVTQGTGPAAAPRHLGWLREAIVAAEVALAFVLAAGGLLVVREMVRLERVNSGIDPRGVVSLHLTPRATAAEYARIEEAVVGLPGVEAAALTQLVPLQNWGWMAEFNVRGRMTAERWSADLRYATPAYFRTLRIPLRQGRTFTAADVDGAPAVLVVNEALVDRYLRGIDPIGLELDRGTIVGVVGDVRQAGLDVAASPEIYYPVAQNVAVSSDVGMALLVRTRSSVVPPIAAITTAIRSVNPGLAVSNVRTLDQVIRDSLWKLTLYRWSIGAFALLTLLLAAIGLHAVIACATVARVQEFAVRLALGSSRGALFRLVVGRSLTLASAGSAAGAGVVTLLARGVADLPAWIRAGPSTLAAIFATLLLVALLSTGVSALRLARLDPARALRQA